ncbi:DNA-directed RNA polymerase III subunit RPC9 [Tribolium castaneum]|uniref:DNA-directed RNA polymerase III subunit RPC9 n=1 Tax=Tribolium castaneum TaxID=7070 RepID=A0A139WDL6_TRICA|nr:PREDICTED: DNA-directed RNA polymerase III subunit RPC9 [Tribolium castaneum]KYB25957.1 DNA-directed RNA polymerase III subunit RPC9-like Protein [Tribolium castaneum]|eukprot:XP_971357.1 PREDICTED: DNA-directed RNA polymerase III subunit RPC9 [Tribolium castaneum]
MEIVNANSATLSNFEVMKHLQRIKDSRKKHKGQLATITYETLRYLENTPCAQQSPQSITECLKDLEPFNLNKNEKLMLINSPPTTALEIQLMIEESEERLTEEQVEQILQIVLQHFPHIQKSQENETTEEQE